MKHICRSIKILLLFGIILVSQSASTQDLMRVENNLQLFSDGQKTGKLHEFQSFFESDEQSALHFKKFNRNRKAQNIVNYSVLGLLGATGIATYQIAKQPNDSSVPVEGFALLAGITLSGLVAIVGNIVTGTAKAKHKKQLFKKAGISSSFSVERPFKLSFRQNGFGLTVNF